MHAVADFCWLAGKLLYAWACVRVCSQSCAISRVRSSVSGSIGCTGRGTWVPFFRPGPRLVSFGFAILPCGRSLLHWPWPRWLVPLLTYGIWLSGLLLAGARPAGRWLVPLCRPGLAPLWFVTSCLAGWFAWRPGCQLFILKAGVLPLGRWTCVPRRLASALAGLLLRNRPGGPSCWVHYALWHLVALQVLRFANFPVGFSAEEPQAELSVFQKKKPRFRPRRNCLIFREIT